MRHFKETTAMSVAIMFVVALGLMSSPALAGMKVLPTLSINDIVVGPPQKWVQGGKFLEGPICDLEGNLWVVSIASGWISKITPDGKWTDVFHSGGQPQGLEWGKDGRLYGTDRKRGVFVYDPKTKIRHRQKEGGLRLRSEDKGGIRLCPLLPERELPRTE